MKTFYKICIILAGISGAFGIALCIAAVVAGASPFRNGFGFYIDGHGVHSNYEMGYDRSVSEGSAGIDYEDGYTDDYADDYVHEEGHHTTEHDERHTNVYSGASEVSEFDSQTVKNLDISVDAGTLRIHDDGETGKIAVASTEGRQRCKCELDGDTLRIKQEGVFSVFSVGYSEKMVIDVYVPEGMVFESVKLELDAGKIIADCLNTAQKLEVDVDAGSVEIDSYTAKFIEADVDAGSAKFYGGSFSKSAELSCDAGSIEFNFEGAEDSVNYVLEASAGSIKINGEKYQGLSYEQKIDHHADRTLKAEISAGSIEIYTD